MQFFVFKVLFVILLIFYFSIFATAGMLRLRSATVPLLLFATAGMPLLLLQRQDAVVTFCNGRMPLLL